MAVFGSKKYRAASHADTLPARYRVALAKHPFALFGLPFIGTILLGSFFLTPATALRYERHDQKVKQLSEEEKLGIGKNKRKVDIKDEYYVRALQSDNHKLALLTLLSGLPRRISKAGSKRGLSDYQEK